MSNNYSAKNGLRQQQRSSSARLEALEAALARALVGTERRLGQITHKLNHLTRVVEAVVEAVGPEEIQAIVDRRMSEEAEAVSAQEKQILQTGLDDGYVTPSVEDKIDETSLIIGYEVDGEGQPIGTGRQQVTFRGISPEAQAELRGKGVGTVIKTPTGGTFEVKEIFTVDEEKARAILTAKAQQEAEKTATSDEKQGS